MAVVTNNRIFVRPTEPEIAGSVLEALMASPTLSLIGEGPGYWKSLRNLIVSGKITGARVHDARIAAICLQHRVKCLWTADRDFSRFPALKCRNPLTSDAQKSGSQSSDRSSS
jgi:hypothetical protein